nr:SGNH/GDSL hydrolase family protein [uncultured Desulfobulbus sp.]
MEMKRILVILVAAFCLTTAESNASSYSAVIVYGDSLSDNGNLYNASQQTVPPAPYYNGRRSNGPVAVEYLAQELGTGLIDFAWIGATTGIGNYADNGTTTDFGQHSLPGMTTTYDATKSFLSPYIATGLFVVWGGPNDFLAPSPYDVKDDGSTDWGAVILRAVTNELGIISDLVKNMGVKNILVPGMPDLGLTPYFQGIGQVAEASALSDAFNDLLRVSLPAGVIFFDTAALMQSVVSDPAAYGFTNVSDACFDGTTVCDNPTQYLFFDDFHPTTATHEILGKSFAAAVVPEPSTIVLFFTGLCGLARLQRRKLH